MVENIIDQGFDAIKVIKITRYKYFLIDLKNKKITSEYIVTLGLKKYNTC